MGGYAPKYDEESTEVVTADDGVPFEVAKMAAIEEVKGVQGDIDEGDAGGRVGADPDIEKDLAAKVKSLKALAERDVAPGHARRTSEQDRVVAALVDGVEGGFGAAMEDETPKLVQAWIDGRKAMDDVVPVASREGYDGVVVAFQDLGWAPSPSP